jgi:transposase-like protein
MDETYIKVRGQWRYLYRAIDSNGDTVEFWFSKRRNLAAAKRFLSRALKRHGRPERIVSTAVKRTGKPSSPAILQTGFRIDQGAA